MDGSVLINNKVNDLITHFLTNGVQPSELADNIFLSSYTQIKYTKVGSEVIAEVTFEEEYNLSSQFTTLRYFYGLDRKVYRIEEEIIGKSRVIWNRNVVEQSMVDDILKLMRKYYAPTQVTKFFNSLPDELKRKIVVSI